MRVLKCLLAGAFILAASPFVCMAQSNKKAELYVSGINRALRSYPTRKFSKWCPDEAQDQIQIAPDRRHILVDAVYWQHCTHYRVAIDVTLLQDANSTSLKDVISVPHDDVEGSVQPQCKAGDNGYAIVCAKEVDSPHMWNDEDGPPLVFPFAGTSAQLNELGQSFLSLISLVQAEAAATPSSSAPPNSMQPHP